MVFEREKKKSYGGVRPICTDRSCNKNDMGRCVILTDTDFGGKHCPFKRERYTCAAR